MLLLSLLACPAPKTDTAGPAETGDTGPTGPAGYAVAERACAPDDGGAVRFIVGIEGEGCEAYAVEDAHVRISLWETAPLAPGSYPFDASTGSAWYSADGGPEEFGGSGVLTIDSWDDSVVGSYELALDSGGTIAGTFSAFWCDTDPRCG